MSEQGKEAPDRREERRRRILSEAVRLFATRGLAATKVAQIADRVGMAQGLLYHYFPSKEAIFVEIVRMAFDRMNRAARELERLRLPAREKLELLVRRIRADLAGPEDFAWFSALISTASISDATPAAALETIRRERDLPYRVVARIVRAGQRDGTVRPGRPADLALVFWTAVKGLALHKVALGKEFRAPAAETLATIFYGEEQP